VVPPGSGVTGDVVSVQRNPLYWGPDSQEFCISRWLMPPSYVAPPNTTNESAAHPNLLCPVKCSFFAFSGGFRACLGKKFAQVEFCTLLATLLKDHSVELVQENRLTWEKARAQTTKDLDNRVTGLAMRMRKKVKVRFVKKGAETFPPRG
jgi:cytochrome P450